MSSEVTNIEAWIVESLRRGEKITVLLRNETTKEEVLVPMNPIFIAQVTSGRIKQ